MTRSDQLRLALDLFYISPDKADEYEPESYVAAYRTLADAAEFALRVWEGDQQLVEQVAEAIRRYQQIIEKVTQVIPRDEHPSYLPMARAVLAAIGEEGES